MEKCNLLCFKQIKEFSAVSKLLFVFAFLFCLPEAKSEGTAQWMPTGMRAAQEMSLMLYNATDGNERLGTTGCTADERIYIRVSSNFANERIYIGMNVFDNTTTHFRVMDPNGTQVYPASVGTLAPVLSQPAGSNNTGEGYIATLTEARNGPEEVFGAGGFDAISISPAMAGDFYIEFNGANSTTYTSATRHQVSYFDVTVANTNGLVEGLGNHTAINGRLYAFQWSLYNLTDGLGFNDVDAEYFLYQSDDSLVLSVQWDLVKAGGWDIAFTRDGVQATGVYDTDRQSQAYTTVGKGSVVGEFPIFFNDPDTNEFPSAGDIPELTFLEYDRCSGSTCFLYNITKGGQVEILIDLNENGTFDPGTADRLLVDNQPAGTHCLAWDDLDGLGDLVVAGQAQAVIKYQAGIFHMPLGDVEANPNGFDRTLIRPLSYLTAADSGRIYYDHTVAGGAFGATSFDFDGVTSAGNIWSPDDGDQLYLNTWFSFAELRDTLVVTFNTCDKDEDGLSDVLDIDDDNDGIPDIVEMYNGDHDGDGVPDYEDADFCTATFSGVNGWDCADGLPDPSDDLDGDGIRNAIDSDFPNCGSVLSGACATYDSDLDGIPDYLDRDSDNDGISDLLEIGGVDTDGNGEMDDLTDTDGDGLPDDYDNDDTDGPTGSSPCATQPGCLQGVSTNSLLDTNNDGTTDNSRDTDGDGLSDYIDLDADNDGIPDVVEIGGTDTDGDGFADSFVDIDGDGFNDEVDGEICTDSLDIGTSTYVSGSSTGIPDGTDADGQPDGAFAELYTLGDLIVLDFGVTLPAGSQYVITWRRKATYGNTAFADIVLEESTSPGSGYVTNSTAPSTDENVDFISTLVTSENAMRYLRIGLATNSNDDIDLDAVKWYYNEEQCVAGTPILISGADTDADGEPNSYPSDDFDGDGILDHLDLDADNDGIPDVVEAGGTDTDGDGRFDDQTDTDNDGFADDVDGDVGNNGVAENSADALQLTGTDTDSDGVPNSYPNDDTDGDGLRDQLDLDADNDGIPDVVEAGGTDTDGDGIFDDQTDSDNDGFADDVDGDVGNDGTAENSADALQLTGADTDNDGAPNSFPNDDTDGDGIVDQLDLDADNDGIPDVVEAGGTDTDGDGIFDDQTDTDGDGFADDVDGDVGNDGTAENSADALQLTGADTDNDGSPNSFPSDDTDGDGIVDQLDLDADNDGIPDVVEAGGTDTDGDGRFDDQTDSDNDGFADDVDGDVGNDGTAENSADALQLTGTDTDNDGEPNSYPNDDKDGDGIRNQLDLDADNDGIPDVVEAGGTDVNGDGRADNYTDTDADGYNDDVDGDVGNDGTAENSADALTLTGSDTDDDGTPNSLPNGDFDQDGSFNFLDLDSDDDGILDVAEAGGTDVFSDGIEDSFLDADGDGYNDNVDGDPTNALAVGDDSNGANTASSTTLTGADTDNDGAPNSFPNDDFDGDNLYNFIDIDADNDGIVDNTEGQGTLTYIAPANADADGDGIDDAYDADDLNFGGSGSSFGLSDIDFVNDPNSPDYLDIDTDSDGDLDVLEGHDSDNDGIADAGSPANTGLSGGTTDADGDGLYDGWDNNTSSTDPTNGFLVATFHPNLDLASTAERDWREGLDNDNDGIADVDDIDDDNDGILDVDEGEDTNSPAGDEDGDGIPNFKDTTDDGDGGDGSTTNYTDSNADGIPDVFDTDGDGIPNLYDLDSDNDGIPDIVEAGGEDTDGNGLVDDINPDGTLTADTDNDGLADLYDNNNGGTAITNSDTDGDGIPDYLDLDADNDGIPDVVEAGGTDTDGDGIFDDQTDTDGDGFADDVDGDVGQDGTSENTADALQVTGADTDNDGVPNSFPNDDTDGDGIVDQLDLDADNDGIPDVVEAGGTDTNGDGRFDDQTDTDGDGFADDVDGDVGNDGTAENSSDALQLTGADTDDDGEPNSYPNDDKDGDGIRNQLDLDADNDGIPDVVEAGGTDVNGDGRADNYTDTDSDGFNDDVDGDVGNDGTAENSADALTLTGADTDNDGAPNSLPNDDFDQDGSFNFLDLDADDDGILDVTETGGTDADSDGIEDSFTDADGDGYNDNVDGDADNSLAAGDDTVEAGASNSTLLTDADANGDGAPDDKSNDNFDEDDHYNFLDIDADNDGITDNTEGQGTATYIAPANSDSDGDGIDDAYDADDSNFGGSGSSFALSDIDAADDPDSPDYLDLNSDDDFYLDAVEGHDSNSDGVADSGSPSNTGFSGGTSDIDGDGLYDGWDNNTASTDPTNTNLQGTSHPNVSNSATTERDWREIADKDNDGIADEIDIDKDNDGILDRDECLTTGTYAISGGDGGSTTNFNQDDVTYAYIDFASIDNSATITVNGTALNANNVLQFQSSDFGAGQIFLEFASDGAAYSTPWLANNNGLPRLRVFIDENGQVNLLGTRNTSATSLERVQPRDGSSFNTITWVAGSNTFSVVNLDGSGPDAIDGSAWVFSACDTDGDGYPDYCDLDSDNDGIPDIIEAGGTDADNNGVADNLTDNNDDGWADIFDSNQGGTALPNGDQDGDGFENRIDLDADDDGIADIIEAGGVDANGDGFGDTSTDTDADGWFNLFDGDNGGTVLSNPDTDGDGLTNYLDLDSDSDGITDNVEGQTTLAFVAPLGTDIDNDGWDDRYDGDVDGGSNGTPITLSNNEGVGNPDYTDDDSDGDGFLDWIEGFDDDEDGDALDDLTLRATNFETAAANPGYYVNTDDTDADDIPNWLEDDDADNVPNFLDPDNALYQDTDGDGIVDLYDTDNFGVASITPDTDGDGEYDFRDIDDEVSLPVELVSFNAYQDGDQVALEWITETEINNDYFTIERSTDGVNFIQLLNEDGAGNSTQRLSYMRFDANPEEGLNYYRLSQTDFDGSHEKFNIVAVEFKDENQPFIEVYPNPSIIGSMVNLRIGNFNSGALHIEVRDSKGQLVYTLEQVNNTELNSISIELPFFNEHTAGVYFIKVAQDKTILIEKVIRQ